jgi:hypothetical protein
VATLREAWPRSLRAELAAWNKKLDSGTAARASVEQRFNWWRRDPDLAGLREPDLLDKLPVAESRACREMWREIDAQIERAGRQK